MFLRINIVFTERKNIFNEVLFSVNVNSIEVLFVFKGYMLLVLD